jgi:hypothetical protein
MPLHYKVGILCLEGIKPQNETIFFKLLLLG